MKNTNLLKSVSFLFFVICSTLQGWGETFTVNSSITSSDPLFSVAETMTNYTYSSTWTASDKLISFTTGASITVTNVTGATITAITAEGVAANNANKTVSFTASDGTTTADGTSESWNNRKSTTMTTGQAFNSANVNNFKCGAGQTYTFTNKSSGSYAAGARIVITYTSTLPTSLTNGATTDNSQAVSWTAPSPAPANGYLVAYSTLSTAPGNSVTSSTGSYTVSAISAGTTSATLSALSPGTTYYWWVRSKNARGNSSWVAGASFTTTVSACMAPSSVGVSGTWRCFPGQTIIMTATPTGGTGTPSYQWQKEVAADNWSNLSNGTSDGVTISGATTNNLQITNCGTGNSGNYRCVVSTGATCSTTSDAFSVKIYTLNGAYDDNAFTSNNITYSSGTTGTATVHLAAGRVYKFKVTDNFGTWYGNTGRILEPAVDWTFSSNESENCVLFTGPEGDYTFTVDIDHVTYGTPEVVVSVGYPDVIHPAAGYAYFRNVDSWANVALYMWYEGGGKYAEWGSDPWVTRTTTICGNTYYYTPLIPSWYNRVIFHNAGGSGQTGDIVISNLSTYSGKYNDKSDASFHDFTTHTISFAANGGSGSMSSITGICPGSDQALTANSFTMAGCAFDYWTSTVNVKVGGVTVTAGSAITGGATLQDISADIPLSAHWKCNTPSISFDSETNTVTISAPAGATAYYTTDGSIPTSGSTAYSAPFTIDATKTIKTIAIRSGCTDSDVASQTCTYVPPVCFKMVADSEATSDATLSSGESITAGSKNCLTLSGGTAKYIATDGSQTMKVEKSGTTTYGWYFGSNKNTIQITLSGHLLQTGSTITIYGHSDADKGFAINGVTTVTNTGADGAFNGTYTVLSSDADLINKNMLTITRVGGSSIRMYSITISNCKSGTICVTPVLPSLTTPNQGCTTSDFDPWNATVTNASAISAASGSQSVSYSWKNSSSVEVATTASYKPTAAGTYTVTATVHSDASGYIDATATSSTLTASLYTATSISTQPTTAVDAEEGENFTLGTGMVAAGQGTKTYQWYSYTTSGGAGEASISGASSATYTTSKAAAGTYYYKVKVTADCGTVASNMITVTVTETPCLRATITKSSKSYSLSSGETKDITSDATVTSGGAVKLVNYNAASKDFSFSDNGVAPGTNDGYVEVVLPSGSALDEGSVIRITGAGTEDGAGLLLIDDAGTTIASQTNNGAIDFSYTVTSSSTLKYLNHIRIKRAKGTSKNHFKSVTITGCIDCTPITPTLSYSATTLYLEGGANTATPTLTGNTGSGAVTYSSSNTSAVKVNASTGVITAVASGTAIITATIAPSGDYCGAVKSVTITVPSLVQQTVNLNSEWTTVPNMTFPGDPTSTLTKNANVAATGYAIDESNNKSGLSSKIYNVPSSTSKNDSYYMSLEFNTPSYGVRLTKVVVPIQPIAQTVSAIVTVSDGTTTVTSNEVADIEASKKKTCTFTITPTTFAAGKTITIKIFVYDQTTGTNGFRFGSPILVNGSVITSEFEFTGDGANANWDTPANWNWGVPPTINNDVVIKKPATVNVTNAKAKSIVLDQSSTNTGSLEINAGKELAVAQTVKVWDGSNRIATTVNDIVINSTSSAGLGALVMGEHNGTNKATVNFTTRSKGIKDDNTSIAQYVGTPFNDETNILHNWYNSWVYGITYDGSNNISWERVNEGQGMTPFRGYCVFSADGANHVYWEQGTLNASTTQTITGLNYQSGAGAANPNNENLLANSWMAPIKITAFEESDFTNADATIYIFNSGSPDDYETNNGASTTGALAGQYSAYTPGTAAATDVIPAMQSFSVFTTGTGASVKLDYDKIVYQPALAGTATPAPNKIQRRERKIDDEANKLRLFVRTESGLGDMLYMWEREDFSEAFENGWDGRKMYGESYAPQLYAITSNGNMAIICVPTYEGAQIGFRAGEDNLYTFTFEYDDNAEPLYLYDKQADAYTRVMNGNSYSFTTNDNADHARFSLTYRVQGVATGVDSNKSPDSRCQKILLNERILILRDGKLYDVTGKTVK